VKLGARLMMACVLGACAMQGALGAILCADSAASIVSMLATAASNGESNYVRIVGGTYSLTSEPTYAGTDTTGVDISGGWNGTCTGQDAGATVLDGQGNMRTLVVTQNSFFPSATINVHDLTFNNGHAVYAVVGGGGLYAFDRYAAVVIESNRFLANSAEQLGGGLEVSSSGPVTVRNNLFVFNSAAFSGGAGFISTADPNLYVNNNTVAGNSTPDQFGSGGLDVIGLYGQNTWISNNLFWLNQNATGAADLFVGSPFVLFNNDISGVSTAPGITADPLSTGNVSVDPGFASCSGYLCFNFHLGGKSPLINAGFDGPPGGYGPIDLDGLARVAGAHVDIGAYELDRIFAGDFD
jgi:hypothetical protein